MCQFKVDTVCTCEELVVLKSTRSVRKNSVCRYADASSIEFLRIVFFAPVDIFSCVQEQIWGERCQAVTINPIARKGNCDAGWGCDLLVSTALLKSSCFRGSIFLFTKDLFCHLCCEKERQRLNPTTVLRDFAGLSSTTSPSLQGRYSHRDTKLLLARLAGGN